MKAIYEPKGAAREYAELACNLYKGCRHGCTYCYVPAILRKTREEFREEHALRPGILEALKRDADRMRQESDQRRILFCFTSDPYQLCSLDLEQTTRKALLLCRGLRASVLTKGGLMAACDFDVMELQDIHFGTTLTMQSEGYSKHWEPGAALPYDRKEAIHAAHDRGIYTWVSLEPVLDPATSLSFIPELAPIVDFWHVGRWNHDVRANDIDWPAFVEEAWRLLVEHNCAFRFKNALLEYLKPGRPRALYKMNNELVDILPWTPPMSEEDHTYRADHQDSRSLGGDD